MLASLPLLGFTALISFQVIMPTVADSRSGSRSPCSSSTSSPGASWPAMFDRERLITGTRS